MVDLVIVGSIGLDDIKTPYGEAKGVLGGSVVYAGFAASFFSRPGVVGIIGSDFSEDYLIEMKNNNIDISGIELSREKTFRWGGVYSEDVNNRETTKLELNAFSSFQPKIPQTYKSTKYLFLGNISPSLQIDVLRQVNEPDFVVADTMNYWIENDRDGVIEIIKNVDAVVLNDSEAKQLFSSTNIVQCANNILSLGPKYAIIKKGEHGSILFSGGKKFIAPAYPLEKVLDPTGAGDSFAGGMLGYIAKTKDVSERNMRKAIMYGSVIASYNAEGFSVNKIKSITKEDIENRFNELREMREF